MGDQIGEIVEGNIYYIPFQEFKDLENCNLTDNQIVKVFSNMCRVNILFMIANAGSGHIGSSFSSIEIMSLIYKKYIQKNPKSNIFFSSKGHDSPALYNVLISEGLLEFENLFKLRRINGLPGHPDINTKNIITNTGSLGMGISKAKGMITADRLKGNKKQYFVLLGDGELQEGQIWESLVSAVNSKMGELTVIVDHNKLQSDTLVSKVSDLGNLELKFKSFGWHVERCDGNDIDDLSEVFERLDDIKSVPKIIIADTIKGKGVSFMEHTSIDSDVENYKFHSGAPDSISYNKACNELIDKTNLLRNEHGLKPLEITSINNKKPQLVNKSNIQKLIPAYTKSLIDLASKNKSIVALDADLILDTGLIEFEEKFPERFVECGIAEQDMVSQAGGMALNGLLPIVHSFSCFLSSRPNEQMYNNSTEKTKIIYVGSLAGLIPGGPGHSHQAVRDIASLSGIPNLTIIEPCCESEVFKALDWAVNSNINSTYIRLTSIPIPISFNYNNKNELKLGSSFKLKDGKDCMIISHGPLFLSIAHDIATKLKDEEDVSCGVINIPWLNYIDSVQLIKDIGLAKKVLIIDNHYADSGLGMRVKSTLSDCEIKVSIHGIKEIPKSGTNQEILDYHGYNYENLKMKLI